MNIVYADEEEDRGIPVDVGSILWGRPQHGSNAHCFYLTCHTCGNRLTFSPGGKTYNSHTDPEYICYNCSDSDW